MTALALGLIGCNDDDPIFFPDAGTDAANQDQDAASDAGTDVTAPDATTGDTSTTPSDFATLASKFCAIGPYCSEDFEPEPGECNDYYVAIFEAGAVDWRDFSELCGDRFDALIACYANATLVCATDEDGYAFPQAPDCAETYAAFEDDCLIERYGYEG